MNFWYKLKSNFSNFNLYSYMRTVPNEKIDKLICEDIIEPLCYMEKDNDGNGIYHLIHIYIHFLLLIL